jgi:hypothetical protein
MITLFLITYFGFIFVLPVLVMVMILEEIVSLIGRLSK